MKILDRYILFTFVKTFLSIFIILMFIFVLQSVWLYIQELAGRDLDFGVVLKFLLYVTPSLVSLVLPLSVLLTSIMTFGNFAENYEFAAMKSTGISLQRAMKSVIYFVVILGIGAFFFADNIIPSSQYEFTNLRRNIGKLKPAMAIRSGQFTEMGDEINIRVAEKYGERDEFLTDVIIHKKEPRRIGNYTVIKAKEGELISSLDSEIVSLQLKDGNYYSEVKATDYKKKKREPFAKSYFDTYTLNIDLSALDDVDLDDKSIDNSYKMYNVKALDSSLVVLTDRFVEDREKFSQKYVDFINFTPINEKFTISKNDSLSSNVIDNFDRDSRVRILEIAKSNIINTLSDLKNQKKKLAVDIKRLNKFEIAIHEKYVLGFSCILLFFVGAPLGAIIRKGGLGLPIVVGVVLFLTFHFVGIFAKNSAEDDSISPFLASWLSTFILLPLGIYLTYRATTDQGLFDWEWASKLRNLLFSKNKETIPSIVLQEIDYTLSAEEEKMLDTFSSNQLKDVVKNWKEKNYTKNVHYGAIERLKKLGITIEHLKTQGYYNEES